MLAFSTPKKGGRRNHESDMMININGSGHTMKHNIQNIKKINAYIIGSWCFGISVNSDIFKPYSRLDKQ